MIKVAVVHRKSVLHIISIICMFVIGNIVHICLSGDLHFSLIVHAAIKNSDYNRCKFFFEQAQ